MFNITIMLTFIIGALVTISSCGAFPNDYSQNDPMENPDLFGGDMLGVELSDDRNAIVNKNARWPNGTIPYVLDRTVVQQANIINYAMQHYHNNTCIKFVPRTTEQNYVRIFAGKGCYSMVGMTGGEQQLSLGKGCMRFGTVVHELGHAIGFYHEQNRSDRDTYLIIHWDNIIPGMKSQFMLLSRKQNLLLDKFDYDSIMLYGNFAFSKGMFSMTMEARNGKLLKDPYNKPGLSKSDIKRIRKLYKC